MTDKDLYIQFLDATKIKYIVMRHDQSELVWVNVDDAQPVINWNGSANGVVQASFDIEGKLLAYGAKV